METDKMVVELEGFSIAIDTGLVAGIKEVEQLPFMPGQKGLVSGIISLRNEPVTVINIHRAFGIASAGSENERPGPRKIIVINDKGRLLGIDIGSSVVSFLWGEELKGKVTMHEGRYIKGRIEGKKGPIRLIDPGALFDEASRILSTEGESA
ncbi:MAG: chemotaxis protein CheW [Thermodesulfobacteriota bacterium]